MPIPANVSAVEVLLWVNPRKTIALVTIAAPTSQRIGWGRGKQPDHTDQRSQHADNAGDILLGMNPPARLRIVTAKAGFRKKGCVIEAR